MRPLLCVLLSLALFPLLAPAGSAFSHSEPEDYPHFEGWSAPLDLTGDIAIGFTVDFGDANQCTFRMQMTSVQNDEDIYLHGDAGIFRGTAWSGRFVQAHAAGLDTRHLTTGGLGGLGIGLWVTGPMSGTHQVTMNVFSAGSFADLEPIAYGIGCESPFTVTNRTGGHTLAGFTHQSFDGTGASVNGLLVGASVNLDGTRSATFAEETVHVDWMQFGGRLGTFRLHWGDAIWGWDLASNAGDQVTVGGGTLGFSLDRVGASTFEAFLCVAAGHAPVDHFDELV